MYMIRQSYGWVIESEIYEGMVRNVSRLEFITKDRVQDEFCKMLTCKLPVMAMELLRKTGAMHYLIPELEETYSMTQNEFHFGTIWEYTMVVLEGTKDNARLYWLWNRKRNTSRKS